MKAEIKFIILLIVIVLLCLVGALNSCTPVNKTNRPEYVNYESGLYYWTSSCKFDDPEREPKAWSFSSNSDGPDKSKDRHMIISLTPLSIPTGRSIRPVTSKHYVPISDITVSKTKLKLEIGDEYILSAGFIPEDATKRNIYWRSGNSAVL